MSLDAAHRNLAVPASVDSAKVKAASAEHARLLGMHRSATGDLRTAKTTRDAAVKQDRRAFADALSGGKDDPGTPNTDEADNALAKVNRTIDALELAIGESYAAVAEAVLDERDLLLEQAQRDADLGATRYQGAVDALTGAHAALSQALATRKWLRRFPETSAPGRALFNVPNLIGQNGDPHNIQNVLAALRELGDLPVPTPALDDAEDEREDDDTIDAAEFWKQRTTGHISGG